MFAFIEINLLPAEYRVRRRNLRIQRGPFYASVLILVAFGGLWAYSLGLDARIDSVRKEKEAIEREIRLHSAIKNEIEQLRAERSAIDGKIASLERISVNREKWVRLLEVFARYLPEHTWLVSVHERGGGEPLVDIEGRTHSFPEVATYMERLKRSAFVESVDLTQLEQMDEARRVYRFRVSCRINPDVRPGMAEGGAGRGNE